MVLHNGHAEQLTTALDVEPGRVHVVGAGYREELFHARGRATATIGPRRLIYIGKYSAAKGLPWLLDALERLVQPLVVECSLLQELLTLRAELLQLGVARIAVLAPGRHREQHHAECSQG